MTAAAWKLPIDAKIARVAHWVKESKCGYNTLCRRFWPTLQVIDPEPGSRRCKRCVGRLRNIEFDKRQKSYGHGI